MSNVQIHSRKQHRRPASISELNMLISSQDEWD